MMLLLLTFLYVFVEGCGAGGGKMLLRCVGRRSNEGMVKKFMSWESPLFIHINTSKDTCAHVSSIQLKTDTQPTVDAQTLRYEPPIATQPPHTIDVLLCNEVSQRRW